MNLQPLKQQLAQMEEVLKQMLRQLPSKTEMPDLIMLIIFLRLPYLVVW